MKPALKLCLFGFFLSVFPLPAKAIGAGGQTRSLVMSQDGIVASEHPFASQAAAMILARGGHAVEAAIAANAVMGVVSPMMCGIGGDLFAIVYEAGTGRLYGLNASGWSPAGLKAEILEELGHEKMPVDGIHTVTVPGAVDGWDKLHRRFGRLPLGELLETAIHYAESGFPVTEHVAEYWAEEKEKLARDPITAAVFLPGNRAPGAGEIFSNPGLAWSYRQLAEEGRGAFYEGPIARRILELSERHGGTMTLDDLREFSAEWVEPISIHYRGWRVFQMPPNGQGIAALSMLNLMEQFPLGEYGHNSARGLHVMIEAKKLAYADLARFVSDPRLNEIPVGQILSKQYASERAQLISTEQAMATAEPGAQLPPGSDTTYIAVVDREGNMVSFIQSVYFLFGSGLVPQGSGFVLQNRGGGFTLEPGHPNRPSGRKRPLHTIIPGFMMKDDLRIAFGIMGGWNQAQAHAQFVSNVVDHQMNIQAALEAPRFTKWTFEGLDVRIESRIPREIISELEKKGHEVEVVLPYSQAVGGGQAVLQNRLSGIKAGASDPRKDGAAIPEPPPLKAGESASLTK